ncbi:MAG: universal stress protein [Labilithrix sp.]|nr:universal stress protein [Labilithrix sp.]
MTKFANILVPVDFGAPSRRGLELAVDLARRNGARLTLLHVFDVPVSYAGMGLSPTELLAPMWDAEQEELDRVLAKVRDEIPEVSRETARGVPWREILAFIEQRRPDLVVMGTHGRHGVPRALLGSVAEKIVRLSPCPVLTVRAEDEA